MIFAPTLRSRAYVPAARSFDRGFERFLSDAFFRPSEAGPTVEQGETGWTLTLDLPGVRRDQLSISIEGAVVRIETAADARRPFKAAYELPQELDVESCGARLEDGVLTLTLARRQPVSNARKIEIK